MAVVMLATGPVVFGCSAAPPENRSASVEARAPVVANPVALQETPESFVLSNGLVSIEVSKQSGDLTSLTYKEFETLTDTSGHPFVYWSHDVRGGERVETSTTIDPAANDGARAEVSVKGVSGGRLMGHGPGAPPEGDLPVDIEIRYALAAGDTAVYTYTIFEHLPEHGAGDMAEARIAAKLSPEFSHIHVDDMRTGAYPLFEEGPDKYVYVSRQWENRAYGWTAPERRLGWFMLIPSPEFLSGGPTKAEFLAHGTSPTVLSYWKSSHNGGANVTLADGEPWQRVVGPIAIYVNKGATPESMWEDAKARLAREEADWPYDWVDSPAYANAEQRGAVSGKLVLEAGADQFAGDIFVGLTQTPYEIEGPTGQRTITWQQEAKHYQFWTRTSDRTGAFKIASVPAGEYNLTAFADGVLGELFRARVRVEAGQFFDLGDIEWAPQTHGRTVWEIGKPDRDSAEFAGADQFFIPGQPLRYAEQFPDDIEFEIGVSDPATDWFYSHMPHGEDPNAEIRPFRGVAGEGRAAPRAIRFDLAEQPSGSATLRIAINGTGSRPVLDFSVNGVEQAPISFGRDDGSMKRHQINGVWKLVDTTIDGSLLESGANTITLTAPEGLITNGVIYDYLRLEVEG